MQTMASAYMVAPRIVDGHCRGCRVCLARQACKTRAILQDDPDEAPFIDAGRCYGCRACIIACPFEAIVP